MTEQDKVNYFNEEIGNLNETDHVQCDICKKSWLLLHFA